MGVFLFDFRQLKKFAGQRPHKRLKKNKIKS